LSANRAIKIARENLHVVEPKANKYWQVIQVNLQRIGESNNKWIYEIEFDCLLYQKQCGSEDTLIMVWVTLNGSILEPPPGSKPSN
jgi:hypothetical protein